MPIITPDETAYRFSLPEVPYGFIEDSQTFWGSVSSSGTDVDGSSSITARFDSFGNITNGAVLIVGGIPSLGIASGSLLLQGTPVSVNSGYAGPHFWGSFLFNIDYAHRDLSYTSPIGVWTSFFDIERWEERDLPDLFKRDWGPAVMSLNSYIGQVKCLI